MAWLEGVTFVQVRIRTGTAIPIVQREEDEKFTSKIIAGTAAGINRLADLKGENFAFGSATPTSGHLMSRYFLKRNQIDPSATSSALHFPRRTTHGGLGRIGPRRGRRAQRIGQDDERPAYILLIYVMFQLG